jgi:hypothetical protein
LKNIINNQKRRNIMSQEETGENFDSEETISDLSEGNLDTESTDADSTEQSNHQEIDNLPIESIGSYARLEELLTDEESEKTTNPTSQS